MQETMAHVSVQLADFDMQHEIAQLRAGRSDIGAVVSFVGLVRDLNQDSSVEALELEHYAGMTEKSLRAITEQAAQRWPLLGIRLIHRTGRLLPSEQIVLVAVASAHRGAAFAACEFIMDYLKTQAPFWKKETTPHGERWLDARESDSQALKKWGED